ncbi:hypothetical protein [Roseovarius sp. MBR-6]|uniref:hypothetical protein n=1 Tax=Roseovarius sp. MBR-6 TaxID=3156459 RepID=UPI0033987797
MSALEILVWVVFGLAQLGDVLTTRAFLNRGVTGAHPLWRWMQARLGRWWWVPRILAAVGIAAGLHWWSGTVLPVAVIAVGIWGVVGWNLWQIKRAL